jgi:hypothetical protein
MGYTENHSFKLQKGLYLDERKGAAFLKARASIKGKISFTNTETTDFKRAERIAISWFRGLQNIQQGSGASHLMGAAAESFISSIHPASNKPEDTRKATNKRHSHQQQWNNAREFFKLWDVQDITPKALNDFLKSRRDAAAKNGRMLSASTLHKDLVTIRQVLKHAVLEGWLTTLPSPFPPVGQIKANPRPWLDPDEWVTLQRVAKSRVAEEGQNPRSQRQREELYDFCLLMVHSCARVDELRRLRVRDCSVKTLAEKKRPYLEMRIRGKTGDRKSIGWSGAVSAYQRLVKRGELQPDAPLFREHHRDGFRELLVAAGLRTDSFGNVRNLKSLRSTALMMRIKANPRINLKLLADNAGTSVAMLDSFYLKRLTVDLNVEELV